MVTNKRVHTEVFLAIASQRGKSIVRSNKGKSFLALTTIRRWPPWFMISSPYKIRVEMPRQISNSPPGTSSQSSASIPYSTSDKSKLKVFPKS